MEKPIDLILVNSIALRQRSISDIALENSLTIIRTYLEDKKFNVKVIDFQRIDNIEKGVPKWCLKYLIFFTRKQVYFYNNGNRILALLIMYITLPVQFISLFFKKRYCKKLIKKIVQTVKIKKVPFVGIKIWYGDSYKWSKRLAFLIKKECPETVVIAGGPQVNVYGEMVIRNKEFDLLISGPSELILEELLLLRKQYSLKKEFLTKVINNNKNSLLLKIDTKNDLTDDLKIKTIPRYKTEDFYGKIKLHTIIDGYGCVWNRCNFCSHPLIFNRYFPRDIEEIIKELKAMVAQGIYFFRFSGSDTPLHQGEKIAQEILKNNIHIEYSMFTRPIRITNQSEKAFKTMIKSGLRAIFIGGETGHDLINKLVMNKGVTKKNIIETIHTIRKSANEIGEKCFISLALIFPCPLIEGVSLNEVYEENISLVLSTQPDSVIVSPPSPFPGTKWFKEAEHFGFKLGPDFVNNLMSYEYTHYKPVEFWPDINLKLGNMNLKKILSETGKLRREIASLGIPTDFSDEYFLMAQVMGCKTKSDLNSFKQQSLVDIITGSTAYTRQIYNKMNNFKETHYEDKEIF